MMILLAVLIWCVLNRTAFGRHIGVQGGFRQVTVDYFIDDDVGDLQLSGPYIGLVARF